MAKKSRKIEEKTEREFSKSPHWKKMEILRAGLWGEIASPDFLPETFFKPYTDALDALITELADDYSLRLDTSRKGLALVAVGGYGRREMSPFSDVDIMVLYEGRSRKEIEAFVKAFMYPLWDMGMDVGYSVRTSEECTALVSRDLTILTALMDSRYLWGDGMVFNRFSRDVLVRSLRKRPEKTLSLLHMSTRKRHAHYGRSIFLLEPHIKEGKGGLRDFHATHWAVWAFEGISTLDDWIGSGHLSPSSGDELKKALTFLWKTRLCLHLLSKRKNDRLTLQVQEDIARRLGYRHTGHTLDVEVFMRDYYKYAAVLNRVMSLMFEKLSWKTPSHLFIPRTPATKRIGRNFLMKRGKIEVTRKRVFEEAPGEMVRAFRFAAFYGVDVGWQTKEYIMDVLPRVGNILDRDPAVLKGFLDIFRKGRALAPTLLQMNQVRLLDKIIPEFKNIYCRVQHDVYHIYTVDAHSIFTVGEIEKLRDIRKGVEAPLANRLAREISSPFVLYLAGFLHDIGKGAGKDHAQRGAEMAGKIADRWGLSRAQKDLLVFLVAHHLLISETAQRRDLFEEKLIVSMAHIIETVEKLKMLYILTYADIRAVGPDAWNAWKGHLIQEFFFKVLHVLERGEEGTRVAALRTKRRTREIRNWVRKNGLSPTEYLPLIESLPPRYLLQTPPTLIKKHLHLLHRLRHEPVVCDIEEDPVKGISETVVITRDRHGLFSSIAGVMAANGINILNAEIHTTTQRVAIDIFRVNSPFEPSLVKSGLWTRFQANLIEVLMGKADLERLVNRNRLGSPVRRRGRVLLPPEVRIDNETSDFYTIIDIFADDRVGLLYDITRTLSALGLDIALAKISTKVDRAADVFYVQDETGEKIYDEERLNRIRRALRDASRRTRT